MFLYALGLVGVVLAMSWEVQREQDAARRRLLGRARARALDEGSRCPYCLDAIDPRDEEEEVARIRCPDCGTRHHLVCWREHGACSVHGCGRVQAPASAESEPPAKSEEPVETGVEEPYALDPRG